MSDGDWNEVARAVRLDVAHVSDVHVTGTTFHALRREMAQATFPVSSVTTSPWLHGIRRDVAVIVRTVAMRQTGESAKPPSPTHTLAIAEIDPPLFAGLRMMSRDLGAYFGFAKGDEPTGHPSLDTKFLAYGFDMMRVREIFLPRGLPDRLGDGIGHASRSCSIVVKDSTVEAMALGANADAARVDGLADIATSIAREISVRARGLSQRPLEVAAREAWQRLAASLGLSIDPLRWHLFGPLGGAEVSAMLEGSPPAVSTTFRARFRARLPCAFVLRRGYRERNLLQRRAKGLGFPELDDLLVLQAADREQAAGLFADPALRMLLAEEARTSNLVLDDREIVLARGGFAGTKEIAARLRALVAIVDRMTPPTAKQGPFR
ncbi:MAG: hypothetical protein JWP87_4713 [Labilithrix sp.]|nr:hypothetical protein [Labilithrix sp.]